MIKRRRCKQSISFQDRLATFAQDARDEAANPPTRIGRDDMLRKARRADTAAHLARFSHIMFAGARGFAKRFVGVLRTSFGVAPGDAGSLESLPGLRVQRRSGLQWAFG